MDFTHNIFKTLFWANLSPPLKGSFFSAEPDMGQLLGWGGKRDPNSDAPAARGRSLSLRTIELIRELTRAGRGAS